MVSWDLQRIAIFTEHHVSVSSHRLMRPNDTKHPDMLALVFCTPERCSGTGHIRCCGSSAHQSQGLYHQNQQSLLIPRVQGIWKYEKARYVEAKGSYC